MNSQFNAIDCAQQLEAAGVPQVQAEVHARTLSHALSTFVASKADLAALDEKLSVRLDVFEAKILARIEGFEARLSASSPPSVSSWRKCAARFRYCTAK